MNEYVLREAGLIHMSEKLRWHMLLARRKAIYIKCNNSVERNIRSSVRNYRKGLLNVRWRR